MRARSRYPADWKAISLRIRRDRAGWRCEWCGAEHGKPHPVTGSKVVLTVAHLGVPRDDGSLGNKHDKHDNRDGNLAALCQRCHLNYDRADHMAAAARTREIKRMDRLAAMGLDELAFPWARRDEPLCKNA